MMQQPLPSSSQGSVPTEHTTGTLTTGSTMIGAAAISTTTGSSTAGGRYAMDGSVTMATKQQPLGSSSQAVVPSAQTGAGGR